MATPSVKLFLLLVLAAMLLPVPANAERRDDPNVVGDLRIQFLSPTLVRLEQRGPNGFEDRNTFTIVKRPRAANGAEKRSSGRGVVLHRGGIEVDIPDTATLKGVVVKIHGSVAYTCDGSVPPTEFFPGPGNMPNAIAIADNPRIIPAKWGATAAPVNTRKFKDTSGWDLTNQALDIYVFLPKSYEQFRKEFLSLTGPTELPPLYTFGLWHSRYHPYSEQEALDVIDHYRKDDIPLDTFVVDTDWRVGASDGYAVNTKLFPNMKRFIDEAHAKHVRLMYNDHPEPVSEIALDPKEMQFREEGLMSLLNMGADVWWYDRNWHTTLREPAPGLRKEVWGAAVFHDITQKARPGMRPLVMSNVPGIDNGHRNYAPHPAAHRFPIWWTGDTQAHFDYLQHGVANAVDGGVESLLPYMSEDLSGHFGNPTPEVYSRFIEYGALSPMLRLHCTAGETRDPWAFGDEAENIVRQYAKLRYRLLPTIYAAARRNYEDGTPIVRRCDLEWPNEKEASRNDQYLLGDDILVAPILTSMEPEASVIPGEMFKTPDGKSGLKGEYFDNKELKGSPLVTRIDSQIDFDWGDGAAAPSVPDDEFSIRWTGKLGPIPMTGDYQIVTVTDDGVRVWIDGKPVIDRFVDMDHQQSAGTLHLEQGKSYDIRMEYFDSGGEAAAHLKWLLPNVEKKDYATRQVWIPPGEWIDLWNRSIQKGPALIETKAELGVLPMWARLGSLVFLADDMAYSSQEPWYEMTVEAFPSQSGPVSRTLYEDDTISNDYKKGGYCKTVVTMEQRKKVMKFKIGGAKGSFKDKLESRQWIFRIHVPGSLAVRKALVDGKPAGIAVFPQLINPSPRQRDFPFTQPKIDPSRVFGIDTGYLSTSKAHEIVIELG